jgi:nucleoside phosphorylase
MNSDRALFPGEWLVCFAVKEEAAADLYRDPTIRIFITGMGRANAEGSVSQAIKLSKPSLVLTCGFTGGLDPSLATGTVLFATESAPQLEHSLLAAGARPAKFVCLDRIAITAGEKRALRQSTGGDAVEMESGHIGAVCAAHSIPCATVRVILDAAEEDLPLDFNQLMTKDCRIDFKRLVLLLFKHPAKIKSLLRLQKQSRAAADKLADVLTGLVR